MEIIKMGLPKEENIASRNKFIANNIFLIGIRKIDSKNYLLLFMVYQDIDDSYIYLQSMMHVDNVLDTIYFEDHHLNIQNLANNNYYEDEKIKSYKELIKMMNEDNIYSCDFSFRLDSSVSNYYILDGVRKIDDKSASVMNIYFPLSNFVRINVYLTNVMCYPNTEFRHEKIFTEVAFNSAKLYNIEKVNLDATCRRTIAKSSQNKMIQYDTHYTMNCGPTEFRMNHITFGYSNLLPKIELDSTMWRSLYRSDPHIHDYFVFEDDLYIIHSKNKSLIITKESDNDKDKKVISILKLNPELSSKTGFINNENIINKGDII